ncbi:sodium/proline symporter PutP [Oceanicaulis sp. MMSF_3324]|uniref:sodium/proline symporter PutP n=1 Tax=Oceanicaulis sp. MMSF_3324 TaxID=3046702 RepID=UPI00273FE471|nr:sodium/proline symporter PutP [Oceanicaulis sp. MMSF_3324]
MQVEALVSLAGYFVLMLGIGLYAYKKSTDDVSGYMLGGRQLHPAVGALSAGASDMSGWMLMGLPGAVYLSGLGAAWIAVGLVIGAYFNYLLVAPRLRVYTEIADDAITIPDYFEKRFHDNTRILRVLSSVVIVIFFTLYTSSGVVAGGKLFEASFGLDYRLGLFLTAGVVIAYTLFGGFLAVSLTDFVQGVIMFIALIMVPIVAYSMLGGLGEIVDTTRAASDVPNYMSMIPDPLTSMGILGIISAMSWGLGYFGQPHIIVRFMAIRTLKDVAVARWIGMTWMVITVIGAVLTGIFGLAFVTQNGAVIEESGIEFTDAETIFILMSQILFHPLVGGFLLVAILAAIMSTISSQLLVSSSSLTEDFYKTFLRRNASQKELVLIGRLSVLVVSLVAIGLAFDRSSSILDLVSNAWAGFGAAFGPLILFSLYRKNMSRSAAIAGMVTGAVVVLFWLYAPITINGGSLSAFIYEIIPGFIASTLAILITDAITGAPRGKVKEQYEAMEDHIEEHG